MYISNKAAFVRNIAASAVNGLITLVILLIAPLGLMAVLVNTFLITFSTFFVCTFGDRVVKWLLINRSEQQLRQSNSLRQRPWDE